MHPRTTTTYGRLTAVVLVLLLPACAIGIGDSSAQLQSPLSGSIVPVSWTPPAAGSKPPECSALEESIGNSLQAMANHRAREGKEAAAPPPNLMRAFERMLGPPGAGNSAHEDYERERSRATDFNARLVASGCKPVDLDARLAQTLPEPEPGPSAGAKTGDDAKPRRADDLLAP